jgi:hypothetical protein
VQEVLHLANLTSETMSDIADIAGGSELDLAQVVLVDIVGAGVIGAESLIDVGVLGKVLLEVIGAGLDHGGDLLLFE